MLPQKKYNFNPACHNWILTSYKYWVPKCATMILYKKEDELKMAKNTNKKIKYITNVNIYILLYLITHLGQLGKKVIQIRASFGYSINNMAALLYF